MHFLVSGASPNRLVRIALESALAVSQWREVSFLVLPAPEDPQHDMVAGSAPVGFELTPGHREFAVQTQELWTLKSAVQKRKLERNLDNGSSLLRPGWATSEASCKNPSSECSTQCANFEAVQSDCQGSCFIDGFMSFVVPDVRERETTTGAKCPKQGHDCFVEKHG